MLKMKECKKQMFSQFLGWLDHCNVDVDNFSPDAWGIFVLNKLYDQFKEEVSNVKTLNNTPDEVLQGIIDSRKKNKEILTPDKTLVDPSGKPI